MEKKLRSKISGYCPFFEAGLSHIKQGLSVLTGQSSLCYNRKRQHIGTARPLKVYLTNLGPFKGTVLLYVWGKLKVRYCRTRLILARYIVVGRVIKLGYLSSYMVFLFNAV